MAKKESEKQVTDIASGRLTMEERFLASVSGSGTRNLKVLRAMTGLTSKKLAEQSGVSHSLIRAIENSHRALVVGPAIAIADATGVDVCSLLVGPTLLEWGGAAPFTEESYKSWIERGNKPTPEQEKDGKRQLTNLCNFASQKLEAGHVGDSLLTAHLYVILGGVEDDVQYDGIR